MTRRIIALVPWQQGEDNHAAIAAAAQLGRAEAVVLGRSLPETLPCAAQALLLAEHAGLPEEPQPAQWAAAFAAVLPRETALLLLPATPLGEEVAARLAVQSEGAALGRCASLALEGETVVAVRRVYSGRGEAVLRSAARLCFASMHAAALPAQPVAARRIALDLPLPPALPQQLAATPAQALQRLGAARRVVSGGRGMGGVEGFAQLQDLAALLDAAVSASLPAVDAGWASVAQQVGQSGTHVTPDWYLAFGMSGTAQHLAGIGHASRIAAINSDPEAEIFRVAELGLIAPWQEVLPRLIAHLQARTGRTA